MTTSVHIAVSGNKQVLVTPSGGNPTLLQPGAHCTFGVHGEMELSIKEIGDFVDAPKIPLVQPFVQPE